MLYLYLNNGSVLYLLLTDNKKMRLSNILSEDLGPFCAPKDFDAKKLIPAKIKVDSDFFK